MKDKTNKPNNAVNIGFSGIKCDKPGCGYFDDSINTLELTLACLNKPCPKCGESLLTQKDYDALQAMLRLQELVNLLVGPVKAKEKRVKYRVNMDGTGTIKSLERKD